MLARVVHSQRKRELLTLDSTEESSEIATLTATAGKSDNATTGMDNATAGSLENAVTGETWILPLRKAQ